MCAPCWILHLPPMGGTLKSLSQGTAWPLVLPPAGAASKLRRRQEQPGGFPKRARSALLGRRSLVWVLTSLLTSESNEEDAGDFSRVSRDHLRCHASPHSPWPPAPAPITDSNLRLPTLPGPLPPPPITDSNLTVTRPFFGSAWLGVSARLLSKLRVCFGWLLPCSTGCQASSSVVQHGRQASVGRLGGPSCESGVSWCRASLDPDQDFRRELWTPWGPAGLSRPGPSLWAALCMKCQGPTPGPQAPQPLANAGCPGRSAREGGAFPPVLTTAPSSCPSIHSPGGPVRRQVLNAGLRSSRELVVFSEFIVFLGMR